MRHGVAPIAVIGNDAGWAQIAREQVEVLGDDVGTVLARTDYHKVAEGYGGGGLVLERAEDVDAVLAEARAPRRAPARRCWSTSRSAKTEFRKGSISL